MMYPATAFQISSAIVRTQPAVESEAIEAGTIIKNFPFHFAKKKSFKRIIKTNELVPSYRWLYQVSSLSLLRLTSEFKTSSELGLVHLKSRN